MSPRVEMETGFTPEQDAWFRGQDERHFENDDAFRQLVESLLDRGCNPQAAERMLDHWDWFSVARYADWWIGSGGLVNELAVYLATLDALDDDDRELIPGTFRPLGLLAVMRARTERANDTGRLARY